MTFKAYEEVHGDQTLTLPIRGKGYVIHPPRADVGYALSMMLAAGVLLDAGVPLTDDDLAEANAAAHVADDKLEGFARQCLNGPRDGVPVEVYEEMLADGLSHPEVEIAAQTAFLAWTGGREAAEVFWNTGGKALAQRRPHPALRQTETPTPAAEASITTGSQIGMRRKARAKAAKRIPSPSSSRTITT
jgi:hypothetical protein